MPFSPLIVFNWQVASTWTRSASGRCQKSGGSRARPSPTTRSTSWRSASCTRSTSRRLTAIRSRSSLASPTHRSSPGFRTDELSSKETWRRWRRMSSRWRRFLLRRCRNSCLWRTSMMRREAQLRSHRARRPQHTASESSLSHHLHLEAKPQTSSLKRTKRSRWTIETTGQSFSGLGVSFLCWWIWIVRTALCSSRTAHRFYPHTFCTNVELCGRTSNWKDVFFPPFIFLSCFNLLQGL